MVSTLNDSRAENSGLAPMESSGGDRIAAGAQAPAWSAGQIHILVAAVLALIVFGSGAFHAESLPPLWFDEGWTVCVAKTWVEQGHYGCLLRGEPGDTLLAAHFPVVA